MTNKILKYVLALVLVLAGLLFYMTNMPGKSYSGVLPPFTAQEERLGDRLKSHIALLAGKIGERNVWRYDALEAAATYIEETFLDMDYGVASQAYTMDGKTVRNLEVSLSGTSLAEEIIVIGAHYDTVSGSPGANDNASGVAALLEIARFLRTHTPARSVRFVAFVNEEPPLFYSPNMGSYRYARRARERSENIIAMLSLETIGYYSDVAGSQHYPNPVYGWLYPDTADFIGFVGNIRSRKLVQQCLDSFRRHTAFPAEGLAAPGNMMGIHWSDHWSFWQAGYRALMVTDTALFRYPHYHAGTDTPDKINYERLARVVNGLVKVTADLAMTGL